VEDQWAGWPGRRYDAACSGSDPRSCGTGETGGHGNRSRDVADDGSEGHRCPVPGDRLRVLLGRAMARLMRAELACPGLQFLSNEQYRQLAAMPGTIMLPLRATPFRVRSPQLHRAAADRRP
jgi:hypothetical protein